MVGNYITWTIIYEYGPYLSSEFHDAYLEYARQVYGIKKSSELWRRCVRGTDKSIDMGVSMLYVTDKESGVTNQSLHRVSITRCIRTALKGFLVFATVVTYRLPCLICYFKLNFALNIHLGNSS